MLEVLKLVLSKISETSKAKITFGEMNDLDSNFNSTPGQ
jgi:hypothetical protein